MFFCRFYNILRTDNIRLNGLGRTVLADHYVLECGRVNYHMNTVHPVRETLEIFNVSQMHSHFFVLFKLLLLKNLCLIVVYADHCFSGHQHQLPYQFRTNGPTRTRNKNSFPLKFFFTYTQLQRTLGNTRCLFILIFMSAIFSIISISTASVIRCGSSPRSIRPV